MFACKNCGGNIIYDIKSKKLVCKICKSSFAPESVTKENDSVDYDYFETTIFTCPQCGAKIMCEDNEASSFCTYCSSSTVLTSRISKEKKPDYIIPFEKTKEECIHEFKKITKKAILAPGELKDDKILDKFKAIYVPYWYYDVSQQNSFSVSAAEHYTDVNSNYTTYVQVQGDIDGRYEGISRDASYNFSDDLCERIAPFFTSEKKKFYPSYLSGFYADVSDVPSEVYEHEAVTLANDIAREIVSEESKKDGYNGLKIYLSNDEATKQFDTKAAPKKALYPVWFMSFKQNKKVAYMTVNGQTGRAASDFPVSIPKFLIATLLLTLLFFLPSLGGMFLFYENAPFVFLDVTLVFSIATFIIYYIQMKIMQIKDADSEDAGKFYKKYGVVYIKNKNKNADLKYFIKENLLDVVVGVFYVLIILGFMWELLSIFSITSFLDVMFKIVLSVGNLGLAAIGFIRGGRLKNSSKYYGIMGGMLSLIFILATQLIAPSNIYLCMASGILLTAGCFMTIMDLIMYHNELTMRKPPHLKRRGGDEIADTLNM
ncbi:MAG: hypothetical protein J5515_08900 [Lachnospiraceae bacterium]|nr:hypothetical protein [Lachnospiraceae bacterium]